MDHEFDIDRFTRVDTPVDQYERQLNRLRQGRKDVVCIEDAVRGAVRNLRERDGRSFVIYGEPQSGKTEMMICLTAKLLDEGYDFILHLLNDSVDLLGQNLGRFKSSGLAPAAKNFTEVLDPAVRIKGQRHVVFCKKNGSDLRKLIEKIGKMPRVVVIDDEADYASPNAKINSGGTTPINDLINQILGDTGIYIGVTATPARLDLNNTFDNDNGLWVNFPTHSKYTGQDIFFPLDEPPKGDEKFILTLLPDGGADPKYTRDALFAFLVNVAYLNLYVNKDEENYSILVHTSGKKADHKQDWTVIRAALDALGNRGDNETFKKYTKHIWALCAKRYPDANPNDLTLYIVERILRSSIIILNSERDWKDNSSAATKPTSLFTIIIGGNIVSRGVTLDNLLAMFFTRDVKHKIQQDTYIQRARMFGSRGDYLRFFELTIPETLYLDWHRCFVFHRLALSAIKEGQGSLVWLSDQRIAAVASSSIDRSNVNLDRGEMSFALFKYSDEIERSATSSLPSTAKLEQLAQLIGTEGFPDYLKKYISRVSPNGSASIEILPPADISSQTDVDDMERIIRKKGFMGNITREKEKNPQAIHFFRIFHNAGKGARLFYKFNGSIQFIKNMRHDS